MIITSDNTGVGHPLNNPSVAGTEKHTLVGQSIFQNMLWLM